MTPKAFLDTNILLDLLLERPGYEDSARILQAGEDGEAVLCCSFLTMANLAFILRKTVSATRLVPTLVQIKSLVKVLPMDEGQLSEACFLNGPDFEDILQAVCARQGACTHIVTRNVADFSFTCMDSFPNEAGAFPTVCTPAEFVQYLSDNTTRDQVTPEAR